MKYKVGDTFLAKATILKVDPRKSAPYFLDSSIGCGWWSEAALNDYRIMSCEGCKWKPNPKCSYCVRNRYIKDNYEE